MFHKIPALAARRRFVQYTGRSRLQMQDMRALGMQALALTTPKTASFIPGKVIPNWWPRILLKFAHLKDSACHMKCGVTRSNTRISLAYAIGIHVRDAREYDPSRRVSQMRRKTRMRRAMIERRILTLKSGARALFRLQITQARGENVSHEPPFRSRKERKTTWVKPSTSTFESMKTTGDESKKQPTSEG